MSFRQLRPRLPEAVEAFYHRFFTARPDAKPMFSTDIELQKNQLVTALSLIVKHISDVRMLESTMRRRGASHQARGVLDEHYPVFREQLLETLQQASGAAWTTQLREDWAWAIDRTSAAMINGAKDAADDTRGADDVNHRAA
ncbi:MAG: globin domain-containing protein [Planctomycetota bacterium]|nr:globin domain-containing protein [Planctomycetota bacterium]